MARSIGVISRINHLLPHSVAKQLYFSLVHSHLTYCNLVWGTCNRTNAQKLITMQQKALKLITKRPDRHRHSNLFSVFRVLCFTECYKLKLMVLIYNRIKQDFASFSNMYLTRHIEYNLRRTSLVSARSRTNYGTQSLDHQIVDICNSFPSVVELSQISRSVHYFKKKVRLLFDPGWSACFCFVFFFVFFCFFWGCVLCACNVFCHLRCILLFTRLYFTAFQLLSYAHC